MSPLRTRIYDGSALVGGGGGTVDPGDTFVLGTTQPDDTNTGCRVATGDLTPLSGVVYLSTPGQVLTGRYITGRVVIQAPNVVIRDNVIELPSSSTSVHGIINWTAGATGALIEHNTIFCAAPNQTYFIGAGIHGSGFTATRNRIYGMTDGIMMAGVNKRAAAYAYGNYINALPHYSYDGGAHADGSHNDAIQVEGNLTDCEIVGNRLGTAYTSCIIFTQNAGTYDTPPVVSDNWFEVDATTFGSMLNLAKTGMSTTTFGACEVKRNRFPNGTSPARMFILSTYLTPMSAAGAITATGADRNVYADGTWPVTVYNGTSNTTSY